jgi:acetolactate synthase regulatory subunit
MNQQEINKMLAQAKALQISLTKMADKAMKELPAQMAKLTDKERIILAKKLGTENLEGKINDIKQQIDNVNTSFR